MFIYKVNLLNQTQIDGIYSYVNPIDNNTQIINKPEGLEFQIDVRISLNACSRIYYMMMDSH